MHLTKRSAVTVTISRRCSNVCATVRRQVHKLQCRQYSCLPRTGGIMRHPSLPLICGPLLLREIAPTSRPSRTKLRLCQRQPRQKHRPCCLPPPPLHHHIWAQSSIPTGGGHSSLHSMSPTLAAPPSISVVKDLPLWIRHPARPCRRTGRRHRPCAPSPLDEVLSSPPIPTLKGGLPWCTINTQQMVRQCYWPHCRHGRRHQP